MTYIQKLQDERWKEKRQEVIERDDYKCQRCHRDDLIFNVHHLQYRKGREPWEYRNDDLLTLCCDCHEVVNTKTPIGEITNPWLVYERMKKQLSVMSPREYEDAISNLSNMLSVSGMGDYLQEISGSGWSGISNSNAQV